MKLPVNYTKLHYTERRKVREEYIKQQDGLCCYCHTPLTGDPSKRVLRKKVTKRIFPKNFFKWPVHLHHDHETGETIGAIHCHCNAVSWEYDGA